MNIRAKTVTTLALAGLVGGALEYFAAFVCAGQRRGSGNASKRRLGKSRR